MRSYNEGKPSMTESQITDVWERMISAEVRSLYFADLTGRYSRRKQWITGLSFFLSSAAAAALGAKAPTWAPLSMAALVLSAYSMSGGLDRKVQTMAKLHYSWLQLATDYDHLSNHFYEDGAERELARQVNGEKDLSQLASTEAPYDPPRMAKWEDHVFQQHGLTTA
jgi:hypothetical protein